MYKGPCYSGVEFQNTLPIENGGIGFLNGILFFIGFLHGSSISVTFLKILSLKILQINEHDFYISVL